jgi:putative hydrolase of the HAD superfamily
MIHNIVFDMGGVLLDYHPLTTCLRLTDSPEEAQFFLKSVFQVPQWEREYDGGMVSDDEMLAIIQAPLATQAIKDKAAQIFREFHIDALTPFPRMEGVVRELRRRGFSLYLLSNTSLRYYRFKHFVPFIEDFQGVLLSAHELLLKPDPAIYRRFCEKFSLRPEECLFIDDRQANIDGALAVGMAGYCFQDGDTERLGTFLATLPEPKY